MSEMTSEESEQIEKDLNEVETHRVTLGDIRGKIMGVGDERSGPPALPPRPFVRFRADQHFNGGHYCNCRGPTRSCWSNGLRKYAFLCSLCGILSIVLGALFLAVYFMLKSYTSSLNYFESIPTYVPAALLITTGFLIICLASRKNRNGFLMKFCGGCSLACALICLTVTVTTAVIHMNRLHTLRECLYTQKTQSCTCDTVMSESELASDEGVNKFVFNSTSDCEIIHEVLYSCLRAVFGLSVIGILICIFTCMLIYQLLSHEKKKMYWAQLEMRCRYLYGQQENAGFCSCCDDGRFPAPTSHEVFPWQLMGNRTGNLYTPSPEDRREQTRSGWNWRRLPWTRTTDRTRNDVGSPDSQYGFSSGNANEGVVEGAPYTVIDPRSPAFLTDYSRGIRGGEIGDGGFYSWGPPPPYSSQLNSPSNSPARRSLSGLLSQMSPIRRLNNVSPARIHRPLIDPRLHANNTNNNPRLPANQAPISKLRKPQPRNNPPLTSAIQQQSSSKEVYENTYDFERLRVPATTSGFNTLPSLKKRNQPQASEVFNNKLPSCENLHSAEDPKETQTYSNTNPTELERGVIPKKKVARKLDFNPKKSGVENHGFERPKEETRECESDVYFGDISNSSCYMSLQEQEYYENSRKVNRQPILNKTNLQLIDKENQFEDNTNPSLSSLESMNSVSSIGFKPSRSPSYSNFDRESTSSEAKLSREKPRKNTQSPKCRKPGLNRPLSNQFRPVREPQQQVDELSSITDSGISSDRNYLPKKYYEELKQSSEESESFGFKQDNPFSHPMFQKPKALPRGIRYKVEEKPKKYYVVSVPKSELHRPRSSTSPKPLPRTTIPRKSIEDDINKSPVARSKPVIPARPLNLQIKQTDNVQRHFHGVVPSPRRRLEPNEDLNASHSVKV